MVLIPLINNDLMCLLALIFLFYRVSVQIIILKFSGLVSCISKLVDTHSLPVARKLEGDIRCMERSSA